MPPDSSKRGLIASEPLAYAAPRERPVTHCRAGRYDGGMPDGSTPNNASPGRLPSPYRIRPLTWRQGVLWGLLLAALAVTLTRLAEVEKLYETLRRGQWPWVLAALVLQGLFYFLNGALYSAAFRTVGVRGRATELVPVWFASICVNVVAPTAGPAIFVDDAALRGESPARASAGAILVRIADFGAFFLFLVPGLAYLASRGLLRAYELLGAAFLALIILGWTGLLLLGRSPARLRRVLGGFQERVNAVGRRFRRDVVLPEAWGERHAGEFADAAAAVAARPGELLRTLAVGLVMHGVELVGLYALFLAFKAPVGLGTVTAGFAVGLLFWIVSITPEGIGVVEGVMTLVYVSLGVPAEKAAAAVLAFRGLVFWLPLVIGALLLSRVRSFNAAHASSTEPV